MLGDLKVFLAMADIQPQFRAACAPFSSDGNSYQSGTTERMRSAYFARLHGGDRSITLTKLPSAPLCSIRSPPQTVLRDVADQIFDQSGHHLEIRERPVGLEHGEFRIVPAGNSFVAKVAVQLEELGESRHEQPFEVEFRGNAKIEVHAERIVMRFEGLRGRAAGDRLHHGRFDFNKAALLPGTAGSPER